jgi:hypothetical protein
MLISVFLNKEPGVQTSPYIFVFWKKREMVKETVEELERKSQEHCFQSIMDACHPHHS